MAKKLVSTKYKEVRIMGFDYNSAFSDVLKEGFAETEGCLIIGDGKMDVTSEYIQKQLEGRVGKKTRIHLCGYGFVSSGIQGCLNHIIVF